ncbi:glycosyltransferase family 4 protein [Anaerosalibacter sp. Marseille-P3206]|uniref:glycosyltransferase family 4 protein n=1 Tax=Anaerosalibacter sp. Marseille-P3206 TaxID=1871005 RepID=UPI0009868810|nr:glycosyltransferase family 4 protein [Anaerosalibacter sp. Marseille-P3206]
MRILHVLAQLPSKTGSGVYYSNLIEGFKKYNHEQKAIFGYQDEYKWDILNNKDQYPVAFKSEELPFPIVGMSNVMPYENTLYSSMTEEMVEMYREVFRKKLEQAKEDFVPDIIFAHHLWILTSLVREVFPDTKIIGICHNTDLRQAKMNPHLKDKYVDRIHELDYVFSASEHQKDEIVNEYGIDRNKIIAVGGGFNQKIFYPPKVKKYDDKVRLVFCAKIDPSKGIYELIEVYKSLGIENVTLDIIGIPNEDNKKKIEEYIVDDSSIRLYNVENQVALGEELRNKDIYLMPSYYEGLGLMAIESLACGLYVVTTEIEALMTLLGEEIKDSGVIKYVPLPRIYDTDKPVKEDLPEFKENLKKAILTQIEKVREKKEFPSEIKDKISSFSWEGLVDNINKLVS